MSSELIYSEVEQQEMPPALNQNGASDHASLFAAADADNFRTSWREIQGDFVDEPRQAVEKANALVGRVIDQLTNNFSSERARLEQEWGQGKDVSTEDLRQALRRYRSFFDRLLTV
jgi:hypothetical protein